ncbi:MAG: hypothetical protein RSF77_03505, partial [Oscillospiraceae bacterium]
SSVSLCSMERSGISPLTLASFLFRIEIGFSFLARKEKWISVLPVLTLAVYANLAVNKVKFKTTTN